MGPATARTLDRARPDDLLQLAVDKGGRVPMAIGALLVLGPGSRVAADDLRDLLLARSAAVPRLQQRLRATPPLGGRAVWLDAGSAAVSRCVDSVEVASMAMSPGSSDAVRPRGAAAVDRALLDAAAELVLTRLPTDGPLWRARSLMRPDGTVAALALVAHHVVADGMGGLAVLGALADRPPGRGGADAGDAIVDPGGRRAEGGGGARHPDRRATAPPNPCRPGRSWRATRGRTGWPGCGARVPVRGTSRGASTSSGCGVRAWPSGAACWGRPAAGGASSWPRPTSQAVLHHAHANGATVNDVVVTAVTGALVELLARRGERVAELVVSVPVSRRRQGEAGALGNQTGVVPVRVPAVPDATARLAALVAERDRVGAPGRGGSAAVLTPAFRGLAAVGAFQPFIDHQRLVHTFVTNVRGPADTLRLAGAEVTAVVPVAVNPGNVAVSFDVLSYAGSLGGDPGLRPGAGARVGLAGAARDRRPHGIRRHLTHPAADGQCGSSGEALDDVLDAADQLADVVGVDRREAGHPQLVAAELAVGLDVDDTVGAQRLCDGRGVDRVVEVDGARRPASGWPGR